MNFFSYIQNLWNSRSSYSSRTWYERLLFGILCCCEWGYRFLFYCVYFYKSFIKKPFRCPYFVISVGNLSAGGTGKSLVSAFLLQHLGPYKGALLMRGYKGANEKTGKSLLVFNNNLTDSLSHAMGDEAFMLAHMLEAPVVVGKNRKKSCILLEQHRFTTDESPRYVVLDDGYQNWDLVKDIEIVLLDARHPFENGHCFPAGRMREKDLSRAAIVIFTHADKADPLTHHCIMQQLSITYPKLSFFNSKHAFKGIVTEELLPVPRSEFDKALFVACAGIGSFSGFLTTLQQENISVVEVVKYKDHHTYSLSDVVFLMKAVEKQQALALLTTRKDWYKIKTILKAHGLAEKCKVWCVDISFEFTTAEEQVEFLHYIEQRFQLFHSRR